jgi:Predicted pPIWI-associating nuclease
MNGVALKLQKRVEALIRAVRRIKTKQLNVTALKSDLQSFVHQYFSDFRPAYFARGGREADLVDLDSIMQELLRCTQRRTVVSLYVLTLKRLSVAMHELEVRSLVGGQAPIGPTDDVRNRRLLETLEKLSQSAATSYEQGLIDLLDGKRKSWRGTAVEFRESLREVLDMLASDEAVKSQSGFQLEKDTKGPTMKQKAVFILKSRKALSKQIKPFADAIDIVDEIIGKFVRSVYERSSVATHTHVSRDELLTIKSYVELALSELLEVRG